MIIFQSSRSQKLFALRDRAQASLQYTNKSSPTTRVVSLPLVT